MNQSRIDTVIAAVKAKLKGIEGIKLYKQGALDLSRAEFYESLVRLAVIKFKEMAQYPQAITIQEAVEKLITEYL